MTLQEITKTKWFYPKNNHVYIVHQEVKMKNPITGEWKDALLYSQLVSEEGNGINFTEGYYVRDKDDFLEKFKPIENNEP